MSIENQLKDRRVRFNGGHVSFTKESYHVWLLEKVQKGIEDIKNGAETAKLYFQLNELTTLRRLLVLEDISTELSRENMLTSIEVNKAKRK